MAVQSVPELREATQTDQREGGDLFGKNFTEYFRFERWILILIAAAFVIRLGLSLAGVSIGLTRWVSITAVLLVGLIYCSIAVHTRRFGGYPQLFGLLLVQTAFAHILIAVAIAFAIVTGTESIYTSPEFFRGSSGATWGHVLTHVIAAFVLPAFSWIIGSVILFATSKLSHH